VSSNEPDDKETGPSQYRQKVSPYRTLQTCLKLSINLANPILNKTKLAVADRSIFEFFPRKQLSDEHIKQKRVVLAETSFDKTLDSLILRLTQVHQPNQSRDDFVNQIKASGLFNQVLYELKPAVVRLLKEKYQHFFSDTEARLALISKIYVELIDRLYERISNSYTMHTENLQKEDVIEKLKVLAEACEATQDMEGSIRYYTDRMLTDEDNLLLSYELATCYARAGNKLQACTLLQQILGRHDTHLPSLLALGILSSSDTPSLAETCFLTVLKTKNTDYRALCLIAVHYACNNEDEKADGTLAEVARIVTAQTKENPGFNCYLAAAHFCLTIGAFAFTERLIALDLLSHNGKNSLESLLLRAKLATQLHDLPRAENAYKEALKFQLNSISIWAEFGNMYYYLGMIERARHTYECLLAYHPEYKNSKEMTRLGEIYLEESLEDPWNWGSQVKDDRKLGIALGLFQKAENWTMVGLSCLRLQNLVEAECSLSVRIKYLHFGPRCYFLLLFV
jgi:tetratricopeptide (TPR) repeat protein